MPKIFISYRRDDSEQIADRIYDELVDAFGKENIFKDVDNIPAGKDFRGILREATVECDMMLVLIADKWLLATDGKGNRRLDNYSDFVRLEVQTGLERRDSCLVIPVLLDNASMPTARELPTELQQLAYLNATSVRDISDFHSDMRRLIDSINQHFPENSETPQEETIAPENKGNGLNWSLTVQIIVATITALGGFWGAVALSNSELLVGSIGLTERALAPSETIQAVTLQAEFTNAVATQTAQSIETSQVVTQTAQLTSAAQTSTQIFLETSDAETASQNAQMTSDAEIATQNAQAENNAIATQNAQAANDVIATQDAQATNDAIATQDAFATSQAAVVNTQDALDAISTQNIDDANTAVAIQNAQATDDVVASQNALNAISTQNVGLTATANAPFVQALDNAWNFSDLNSAGNADWAEFAWTLDDGHEVVLVPTGRFTMGDSNTQNTSQKDVSPPFWIDRYEISQEQYGASGQLPMTDINWQAAQNYCAERGGNLPTDVEWEYAARGVSNWLYPWGDDDALVDTLAVYGENADRSPRAVNDTRIINESWVGAYHMAGNVAEWTYTQFRDNYATQAVNGLGENMVVRGGSFDDNSFGLLTYDVFKASGSYEDGFEFIGFRCVIPIEENR